MVGIVSVDPPPNLCLATTGRWGGWLSIIRWTEGKTMKLVIYLLDGSVLSIENLAVSEAAARYGVRAVVTKEGESISSESDSGLAEVISQAAGKTPGVVRVERTAQMSGSDDACNCRTAFASSRVSPEA